MLKRKRERESAKEHVHTPLHFQTLIYNFNISNFHSSGHFPNVIFQFMSNRLTIFLNTAYDKLGGKVDMQFRLSVLQAQQQTHQSFVCLSLSASAQYFGGSQPYACGKNWIVQNMCLQGTNHNSVINLVITVIIIRSMMEAMIMY